jgi:hypothetical protein
MTDTALGMRDHRRQRILSQLAGVWGGASRYAAVFVVFVVFVVFSSCCP